MSYATLIRAVHLQAWADTLVARQKLPTLVRRLIHATVDSPQLTRFPAEEGTGRRGWDGMAKTAAGNAWVPAGVSVWEMGTNQDPESKANGDYKKRTLEPGSSISADTVFIFVTPRKWEGKVAWCDAKREEGVWKDVLVWDSADLEEWLERAPPVDLWLALLLNKLPPAGVRVPLGRWKDLAAISSPPLAPEVFLVGRQETTAALLKALVGPPQEFAVAATSSQELVDFACAVLEASDEATQDTAARALVVNSAEAWSQLVPVQGSRLFLIPGERIEVDARMVAEAINAGHSVLTARPYTYLRAGTPIPRLPRAPQHDLQQALEASGFTSARAARLAQASGGYLTALVRLASRFAAQGLPGWARPGFAGELLPLLLLGEWVDDNESDRRCVEQITGESYATVRQRITYWLQQSDGPLRLVEGVCGFASREESWQLLAPLLTGDMLDRFVPLATEILAEDDPSFDLPVDERPMASIRRQLPQRSPALRNGVAETLALLGAHGENTPQGSTQGSAWRATRIVESLLGGEAGAQSQRWFSLARLLPTLAEAAPDEFLGVLTADLERVRPAVASLFPSPEDAPDPWFRSTHYTGLLWALQRLAWSRELLSQVTLVLAALVKLDIHYRSSPTAPGILHAIFALWCPHTDADEADRCDVLELLISREPALAWNLLIELIPSGSGFIVGGDKPRFRDWGMAAPTPITDEDLWRRIDWVSERLIALAHGSPERWMGLLDEIEKLPHAASRALLDWLCSTEAVAAPAETRLKLWTTLRQLVARHRFYHDADWAFSKEAVDELAEAEARFAPENLSLRYGWLFGGSHFDSFGDMATPHEELESLATAARHRAMEAILAAGGLETVLALAATVDFPGQLGRALAETEAVLDRLELLPRLLLDEQSSIRILARSYAVHLAAAQGEKGLDLMPLEMWSEEAVAEMMSVLPFARHTWEELRRRRPSAEALYWQRTSVWAGQLNAIDLAEGVEMLRRHDRVLNAADIMADGVRQRHQPHWEIVADLIEQVLRKLPDVDPSERWKAVSIHDLCELMRYLQDSPVADPSRVASLEWNFLLLPQHIPFAPKKLHGEMSSNPGFFVEVLSGLSPARPAGDAIADPVSKERRTRLIQASYSLLTSWRLIPGNQPDGSIDSDVLQTWIAEARRLCANADRAKIGDLEIGKVLSHSRPELDGTWPCVPVRNALESVRTDEILRGFKVGISNRRGVVSKTLNEGGEQERELVSLYRGYADRCRTRWPYTARALRDLADSYERSARSEDESAEGRDF